MERQLLLGIDIGTSSSKGILTDQAGKIMASAVVEHDTLELQPGFFEHDADGVWVHDCWELIRQLKEEAGAKAEEIGSICVSAIGPCVLPVDRDGNPLCHAILYGIDTRAQEEIRELNLRYGEEFFVKHCGNTLSTQAAGPKILWLKRHRPEVFEQAACFMTSTTYLVYRLTGESVIDYYTACAGFTPLFDYEHMCWDPEMCRELGCLGRLPELRWTTEGAGKVTSEAAEIFGLTAGTRVCVGTCDAAAEAVSVGVVDPGQTMLMIGSTAFLISVLDKPARSEALWSAPFLFPGTYALLGGMGCAGSLTKWFLSELAGEIPQRATALGKNPYTLLAEQAALAPAGCQGLIVLPYFCGERTPINDPQASGVIFGLKLLHRQEHLYRAVLEGVALGIRDNLQAMADCGHQVRDLYTVGGGAQNRLWLQIISDVTQCTQTLRQTTIGAAYGDAFLAGVAVGVIENRKDIEHWIDQKGVIQPQSENCLLYNEIFYQYRSLYRSLRGMMHQEGNIEQ